MSVAQVSQYPPMIAAVVAGGYWQPAASPDAAPQSATAQESEFGIMMPGFGLSFGGGLSDMNLADDYSVVTFKALIDPGLIVLVTFRNDVTNAAGNLQIRELSINFDVTDHRPRTHFLAASLYAMLPLGGPIRVTIPPSGIDVTVTFSAPLREVSSLLQKRQTYVGLMVIERATGRQFQIPEYISANEMKAISFTFHAITQRMFQWPAKITAPLPLPANEESVALLDSLPTADPGGSVYRLHFGPDPMSETIFGQTIPLGPRTVFIDDAVFQDFEGARRELAKLDGRIVQVPVRSVSGIGRYFLPEAPKLPDDPWDDKTMACILLEDEINARLADRYNALAASTLEGLTPEEVEIVTSRPTLDDDEGPTEG